jgi:uncharacterized protein YqfB (UPF0267 family)
MSQSSLTDGEKQASTKDASENPFTPGDIVEDTGNEDTGFAVVVEAPATRADEHFVHALQKTVAEANDGPVDTDRVVQAIYTDGLNDALGKGWSTDSVLDAYRAGDIGAGQTRVYSFPESRLEKCLAQE